MTDGPQPAAPTPGDHTGPASFAVPNTPGGVPLRDALPRPAGEPDAGSGTAPGGRPEPAPPAAGASSAGPGAPPAGPGSPPQPGQEPGREPGRPPGQGVILPGSGVRVTGTGDWQPVRRPRPGRRPQGRRPAAAAGRRRGLAGSAAAAVAVVAKYGAVLLKLKVLVSVGSLGVSLVAYAAAYGLPFALGLVSLLAVHEFGHVAAFRRRGIPTSLPVFLPFLGAFVNARRAPQSVAVEAETALAGPFTGTLGALVVGALATQTHSPTLRAVAFLGFLLGVFNLIPVLPLDGGRAAAALHPATWVVGVGVLVLLDLRHPSPIITVLIVLGALSGVGRWRARRSPGGAAYAALTGPQRTAIAASYVALLAVNAVGLAVAYVPRHL